MASLNLEGEHITYEDAGVSTSEGARAVDHIREAVAATNRPEVIGGIGGFGGLFSAAAIKDMEDPILVSGTDGVGTKLLLAQKMGINNTVGIDLVAMCVNDVIASGAEPLFFLDYIAIGKLDPEFVGPIVEGIAAGCQQAGCALVGGEMAEHPGAMEAGDYDLAGFCVGLVDRPKMLGPDNVREGDAIIGLASTGVHSNGFSLVRRALTDKLDNQQMIELREELGGVSIAAALLAPTRIYVKSILAALEAGLPIHALAHITGGGITENLDRAMPRGLDARVDLGTWPEPGIITMTAEAAQLTLEEKLKTFNCGIGMCVICPAEAVDEVMAQLESTGETAYLVGEVIAAADPEAKGKVVYAEGGVR